VRPFLPSGGPQEKSVASQAVYALLLIEAGQLRASPLYGWTLMQVRAEPDGLSGDTVLLSASKVPAQTPQPPLAPVHTSMCQEDMRHAPCPSATFGQSVWHPLAQATSFGADRAGSEGGAGSVRCRPCQLYRQANPRSRLTTPVAAIISHRHMGSCIHPRNRCPQCNSISRMTVGVTGLCADRVRHCQTGSARARI